MDYKRLSHLSPLWTFVFVSKKEQIIFALSTFFRIFASMIRWASILLMVILSAACLLFPACDGGGRQRIQLEELEAMNRADSLMTNDSLALALADWFDRHGTANEQMRAHYILGRTYADLGEAPQAIQSYQDAIDRADTTTHDCDYYTLCRVHAQKAIVYYDQLLSDNMIREEQLAMKYALLAEDTMTYIYCYGMMAEGYDMKDMPDSTLAILKEAYLLYKRIGKDDYAASLCCSMADIYTKKDSFDKAKSALCEFEAKANVFDEDGNIESGREIYYYVKGLYFVHVHKPDSAELCFRKLQSLATNYVMTIAALDGLQTLYAENFNKDSLLKYDRLSDSLSNYGHLDVEMEKTLQVQAMYDYSRNERLAHRKEREADRLWYTLIISAALCIILLLVCALFYIHHKNKERLLKERIRILSGYAVNGRLRESNIAHHFRQLLRNTPYKYPDLNDWKELKTVINKEIPSFHDTLNGDGHTLSDFENDVCMLVKIQLSSSDIAKIKQCAPSYITQVRKNIFQKLFQKKGRADELDEYIMSL